jgi:alcohol dehydrogenase class IV
MGRPEVWNFDELLMQDPKATVMWATPSVRPFVESELPYPLAEPLRSPGDATTLIVIAGGKLLDEAKVWRTEHTGKLKLVAVPSIWGSGAEISPIAVLNRNGKKDIRVGDDLLPDVRVVWRELARSVPEPRARMACGDCWAHALEGFLSPVADDGVRLELAELIREMLDCPLTNDARWFELGARACAGQARSSVGLVHGIAHTLEGPLCAAQAAVGWGHAMLCSTFLWPVMRFNERASDKSKKLFEAYGIDAAKVMNVLSELHDEVNYARAIPFLTSSWRDVLRDPCTRTNAALVRHRSLGFFASGDEP